MAILNNWQKIDRVLPGQPFGDGADGSYSENSIPTLVVKTCSGSADSTTLTADTDASPYSVGDILLIHQTRGTGVGQWEINRVSAVGSDQYTMQSALKYTYTDSGASQSQAIKVPRYTDVTVPSGQTWNVSDWGGDTGGVFVLAANGTLTIAGTIDADGAGYLGGSSDSTDGAVGYCGEGSPAAKDTRQYTANGNGGGGGDSVEGSARYGGGGGGGGHAAAGSNGEAGTSDGVPQNAAVGGSADGSADLTDLVLGGGGGGGSSQGAASGAGGDGGGAVIAFARVVAEITGAVTADGANGSAGAAEAGSGGGGAGGACLIACQSAVLGTDKIGVAAGAGNTTNKDGGNGSVGRIAVHHSGTITGSTTPTLEDTTDTSLIENPGSYMFVMS